MIDLTKITDPYERKARINPSLICLFPIAITAIVAFPKIFNLWSSISAVAISFGFIQLIAHVARDFGKKKEAALFIMWEGMPSVRYLRLKDQTIPLPLKEKYHKRLSKLTKIKQPAITEEDDNPQKADQVYLSWSNSILAMTRDTTKFNLLYKENINYGFRRNLFGLRPFCISNGFLCLMLLIIKVSLTSGISKQIDIGILTIGILIILYLIIFIFYIEQEWVKITADEYGRRLIETINNLD